MYKATTHSIFLLNQQVIFVPSCYLLGLQSFGKY